MEKFALKKIINTFLRSQNRRFLYAPFLAHIQKAFTCVQFLTFWNLANSKFGQRQSNCRCSSLVCGQLQLFYGCNKHIGVGFCVARSDQMGHARASGRGTSNKCRFPRFLFLLPKLNAARLGTLRA